MATMASMTETPSKQLSFRLERLEKDLQLLTGMQTLIMADGPPQTHHPNTASDFPERDINPVLSDVTARGGSKRSTVQIHERPRECKPSKGTDTACIKSGNGRITKTHIEPIVSRSTMTDEINEDNLELLQALKSERERRVGIEDSARIIAVKLQQIEEELQKEQETKQMLLVGTLQLKNHLSGQEMIVKEREAELKQTQEEFTNMQSKLDSLESHNASISKKFSKLVCSLKTEKKVLQAENEKISAEKKEIENQFEESCKQNAMKEQSIHTQEQKLNAKFNQIVSKYAQVDKEREDLTQELRSAADKLELSNKGRQEAEKKLHKLKAECDRDLVLKDCILDKLRSDMIQQKERFELQMKSSQIVVTKTKSLILDIRQKRDDLQKILVTYKQENESLNKKTVQAIQRYEKLYQDYEQFKRKIKNALNINQSHIDKLKKENTRFRAQVKTLEEAKALQLKLTLSTENDFLKQRTSYEEKLKSLETENEQLKAELTRYIDNFRVLQKISEDQTKTIQTLRNEKDEQRKIKFSLETEIRERDSNETYLLRKLEQEERKIKQLDEALEGYQKRVSVLEEELREHNCEEFVETTFKRKLSHIESEARERYEQWEQSLKTAKSERDKAIRYARQHEKTVEETKSQCDSRLLEITCNAKQDFQKLKADMKRSLTEKDTRIMELESSMEQQKLQAQQMQTSLCGKIQQLQCALNVYVTSVAGSTFGNPSMCPNTFSKYM